MLETLARPTRPPIAALPDGAWRAARVPFSRLFTLATVGLLPQRLRDELGLPWSPTRRRLFGASRTVLSALLPVLPRVMREFPPARSADKRLRRLAAAA